MKAREIRAEITRKANRIKATVGAHPEEALKLCEEIKGLLELLTTSPAASEALTRKRLAESLEAAYRNSFEDFKRVEKEILDKGYHWCGTLGVSASWGGNIYDSGKCCDGREAFYPPEKRMNNRVISYLYDVKVRKESYLTELA